MHEGRQGQPMRATVRFVVTRVRWPLSTLNAMIRSCRSKPSRSIGAAAKRSASSSRRFVVKTIAMSGLGPCSRRYRRLPNVRLTLRCRPVPERIRGLFEVRRILTRTDPFFRTCKFIAFGYRDL